MLNSSQTNLRRRIALLMSCLLFLGSLLAMAAGDRRAAAASGPYVPLPEPPAGYTGPLTWMDYTPPGSPIGLGERYMPRYLDVDGNGDVYVTETNWTLGAPGRVARISGDGLSVTDVTYNGNFTYPMGIAVDKDGNLYVADNTQINGSSAPNAVRIMKLPYGDDEWDNITYGESFAYGFGVAADPQGNVYVVDGKNGSAPFSPRIMKLDEDKDETPEWEDITGAPSVFSHPVDIAADGAGNLYVSQSPETGSQQSRMFKLPVDGGSWTDISPATAGPGFFAFGVSVDKYDNVYWISLSNSQTMKLGYGGGSEDWTEIELLTAPSSPVLRYDVAVDGDRNVYSTSLSSFNVSKLMASIIYDGNVPNGGAVPVDPVGYEAGETAYASGNTGNLTKTGHAFGGWSTSAGAGGTTYLPGDPIVMTQSVKLYAVWTPIPSYTVSYQAGEGGTIGGPGAETVSEGGFPVSVPAVTPDEDYTFLGWSSDGGATLLTSDQLAATAITRNVTYTAYFQAPVTLTGIALDSENYRLRVRATHQTVVAAVYSDHSERTITSGVSFSSSNPGVADVDGAGLVTAKAGGTAVITAEYGSFQAQAAVSVSADTAAGSGASGPPAQNPGAEIILDGVKQEKLATAKEETVNGRVVTTIVLDSEQVIRKLNADNSKLLTIPLPGARGDVVGQMTGSLVKALERNEAAIQLITGNATYTLPTAFIQIDRIAERLGSDVQLDNILVSIQVSEASDETLRQAKEAAGRYGAELAVRPVSFTVSASDGSRTVEVSRFNSYVERTITLPEGTDPGQITTGVMLTEDGGLLHVPTVVTESQGQAYARMNSLTNSTYSVIYNPREISDVANHWAKKEVNDMASRLIVPGVTDTQFLPNAPVSRAEFAAIVTRALGIQEAPYAGGFADVQAGDSFAGAVQAAIDYGLIGGFGNGKFLPDRLISRQEAATILAKAMEVAKLNVALSADEAARLLSSFSDGGETASWARNGVAAAVRASLIGGRGGKLDLAANVTRAETAVLVRRLLTAAELINR